MSGHPLHGIRPQAEKIRLGCDWGEASGLELWKVRHRGPGDRAWECVREMSEAAARATADRLRAAGREVDMSRL